LSTVPFAKFAHPDCAATLMPLHELIEAHVLAAERLHGEGKCRTGGIWTYVRDNRPFGGTAPPAAVFFYSPDRAGHDLALRQMPVAHQPRMPLSFVGMAAKQVRDFGLDPAFADSSE
jgi:hypothetical protein